MTASCSATTGTTSESAEVDLLATESATEASSTTDAEVSVPDCCQMAILRSMSDACLSLLNQSGSVFSQFSPQNKPAPLETLMAKNGVLMKSSSLPNLSSQESLDTFSSTERNPSLQQASLYSSFTSAKEEKTQSSSVFFSCPAPKDASLIAKTTILLLNLPESKEDGGIRDKSSLNLCSTKVKVHTYDKETIKSHSSKNSTKTSEESAKSSPSLPKPSTSSLSPLALFSHVQKEITETRLDTKSQEKEESQGEKGQQEHQEQEQHHHKQKKDFAIEELPNQMSLHYTQSCSLPNEIVEFALTEAQLSSLMHMRVSNLDILRICAEIMKLMLNSREQENLARLEARKHLLEKAKELIESYESQAKISQWLGIATATLGIIGAAAPIIGEISGKQILGLIQRHTGLWKKATAHTFFKGAGKICSSLSQLTETSSKIYELKETASRTFSENYKEIFRMEHDEITRSIEEVKDHWKNMDNFLLQILQTEHDAVRSLYQ
ncbi:hypothetical protein [Chlamydia buteonis]|uniref:Uncharacterized protein n=1 Tax=Chlamydia buteonis TaxID=2494525 RepID=A0ABX8LCX1_9CHLA|nr:hypothetical protein [Chlamydia buteonis]QXE26902.1 hypothetical protein HBN95_01850 [Chlamydia buteonis]QXE28153.1 hypothetical protein JJJ19_01295 [Chlamydia buteonis]